MGGSWWYDCQLARKFGLSTITVLFYVYIEYISVWLGLGTVVCYSLLAVHLSVNCKNRFLPEAWE